MKQIRPPIPLPLRRRPPAGGSLREEGGGGEREEETESAPLNSVDNELSAEVFIKSDRETKATPSLSFYIIMISLIYHAWFERDPPSVSLVAPRAKKDEEGRPPSPFKIT